MSDTTPEFRRVIKGTLFREKRSSVGFRSKGPKPSAPKPDPARRPAHVARMLALAHHIQDAIDRGVVADQAAVARKLGFTRARLSQVMDLLLLAPDIQEAVLFLEAVDGVEPLSERALRSVVGEGSWAGQRQAFADASGVRCA